MIYALRCGQLSQRNLCWYPLAVAVLKKLLLVARYVEYNSANHRYSTKFYYIALNSKKRCALFYHGP
jgi:hypothetical protein